MSSTLRTTRYLLNCSSCSCHCKVSSRELFVDTGLSNGTVFQVPLRCFGVDRDQIDDFFLLNDAKLFKFHVVADIVTSVPKI